MFNNKKEAPKGRMGSSNGGSSSSHNSLVQGTIVEGTVTSESDIRIDGTIKGKLHCGAKVIIGPTGAIDGEVKCEQAVIEGKFQGTLIVAELLNIRESATIDGEVSYQQLIVQSGARISGTFNLGKTAAAAKPSGSTSSYNKVSKETDQIGQPNKAS